MKRTALTRDRWGEEAPGRPGDETFRAGTAGDEGRRPLDLPGPDLPFSRADLIFYGVDHSGGSYEGRVFLNAPQRLARDADIDHPSYVGSFHVFGHIGCAGDVSV